MPFSLSVYLYNLYQRKIQDEFDRHNKVLTQSDIESLFKNTDRTRVLRILRSAVVDHAPLDGLPYHLNYPLEPLFYHDRFKRALIADEIGIRNLPQTAGEFSDAVCVLEALAAPEANSGYVQILAWNSLGKVMHRHPELWGRQQASLRKAMGDSLPSVMGALIFCDHAARVLKPDQSKAFVQKAGVDVRYRLQKALYQYYCSKNGLNEFSADDKAIRQFINTLPGRIFGPQDLSEGLKQTGLFTSKQDVKFWDNTDHSDIGRRVARAGAHYLMAVGAYARDINWM